MSTIRSLFRAVLAMCIITGTGTGAWAQAPAATAPATPTTAPAVATSQYSLSDLMVAPTRVIFDGKTRTAEIALINQSNNTLTYRVSFMHLRMNETGGMLEITAPGEGEHFADDIVRFTPRQVILAPKQTQIVRLQLRKPADLAVGEYRSQLLFRVVPSAAPEAGTQDTNEKGISIKLIPIYGVSIPVIVRQGALNAAVTISDLAITPAAANTPPQLMLTLNRTGAASVYGDISIEWTPTTGAPLIIGKLNGISVYTPNAKRIVTIALKLSDKVPFLGGRLHIRYSDPLIGENAIMAEATLAVP